MYNWFYVISRLSTIWAVQLTVLLCVLLEYLNFMTNSAVTLMYIPFKVIHCGTLRTSKSTQLFLDSNLNAYHVRTHAQSNYYVCIQSTMWVMCGQLAMAHTVKRVILRGPNFCEACKLRLILQKKISAGREIFIFFQMSKALPRTVLFRKLGNHRNFCYKEAVFSGLQKFELIITRYTVIYLYVSCKRDCVWLPLHWYFKKVNISHEWGS